MSRSLSCPACCPGTAQAQPRPCPGPAQAPRHSPRPAPVPPTQNRAPAPSAAAWWRRGQTTLGRAGPALTPTTEAASPHLPGTPRGSPSEPDPLQGQQLKPRRRSCGDSGALCPAGSAAQDTRKVSPPPPTALLGSRGLAGTGRARVQNTWRVPGVPSLIGGDVAALGSAWPGQRAGGRPHLRLESTGLGWEPDVDRGGVLPWPGGRSPAPRLPGAARPRLDWLAGLPR